MKKVISLILAAAAVLAFSVNCLAANEASANTVKADPTIVTDFFKEFAKFIDAEAEAKTSVAAETIFNMYSTFREGNVSDSNTFAEQMKEYSDETNAEVGPVFSNMDAVRDIIKMFAENKDYNIKGLQTQIEDSDSLDKLIALYTGAYIVKAPSGVDVGSVGGTGTGTAYSVVNNSSEGYIANADLKGADGDVIVEDDGTVVNTDGEKVIVPAVDNPRTGDSSVGTAAAFAVLGVSLAAIITVVRKKDTEE